MNETKEIIFKPTFFSKNQKLILNPDFIEFYKSPADQNPIVLSKLEIDAFRFGIKWISGYEFYIGRTYCIDIRNLNQTIIKIRITTFYKIRLKKVHEKYRLILNTILNYYISEMVTHYTKIFNLKQPFSILNIHFNQSGIILNDKYNIECNQVDVRSYTRYISISTKTKSDIYKVLII